MSKPFISFHFMFRWRPYISFQFISLTFLRNEILKLREKEKRRKKSKKFIGHNLDEENVPVRVTDERSIVVIRSRIMTTGDLKPPAAGTPSCNLRVHGAGWDIKMMCRWGDVNNSRFSIFNLSVLSSTVTAQRSRLRYFATVMLGNMIQFSFSLLVNNAVFFRSYPVYW